MGGLSPQLILQARGALSVKEGSAENLVLDRVTVGSWCEVITSLNCVPVVDWLHFVRFVSHFALSA